MDRKTDVSAIYNFYWSRIYTKHMTEPWLDQAVIDRLGIQVKVAGNQKNKKKYTFQMIKVFVKIRITIKKFLQQLLNS